MTSSRDNERMVRLTSRPTEPLAAMIADALRDAGIRAVLTGQYTAGFKAEAPGWVAVNVFESDREAAEKVMAELQPGDAADVDWSQVDVGRPVDGV